ncbi:MAG: N-acetyltransferase [Planctomycetes bacterium]|nr:N-acetyltransferase [Planctomycetota bacterium]
MGSPPGGWEVLPLSFSRADRLRFLSAGTAVYRGDPLFVPPLRSDLLRRTDPDRNPFFRTAEVDHLVLRRDGQDVGRIAAIRNLRSEEFRGDRTGWFGWFECPRDPGAARALLGAARERLAARGCDGMVGPVSYSTNDECGLLVEGFDGPPALLMAYNPPWYGELLLGAGLRPAEDLLAWDISVGTLGDVERIGRIVDRARARYGWTLRTLRMKEFDRELESIRGLYNRAWEANWGFVPMSGEEFRFSAEDLRRILDPRMVFLAEREGKPLGFSLALPDFNRVLIHLGGSLLPFGWAKALWYSRRIDRVRVVALGVLPEARNQGIEAALYLETVRRGPPLGYLSAECSWTLERNVAIGRAIETIGGRPYRRYRLYRTP